MDWQCVICNEKVEIQYKQTFRGTVQHHLWGGHGMDVVKSHAVAEKIDFGTLTEQELLELKQLNMPL